MNSRELCYSAGFDIRLVLPDGSGDPAMTVTLKPVCAPQTVRRRRGTAELAAWLVLLLLATGCEQSGVEPVSVPSQNSTHSELGSAETEPPSPTDHSPSDARLSESSPPEPPPASPAAETPPTETLAAETPAAETPSRADDQRSLIVHADDVGLCRSVNRATIEVLEAGVVTSVSIMVPCPAFRDFADYASRHPEYDYGVHLTLNAEWPQYRWGPVLPEDEVPTLVDREGLLWRSEDETAANAKAAEVERELRAQIDQALQAGIPLSHLDTHMGTLFMRPDFLEIYVRLGLDYNLPVLMPRQDDFLEQLGVGETIESEKAELIRVLEERGFPVLETVAMHYRRDDPISKQQTYLNLIRQTPRGVSQLIIHCGIDDSDLRSVMPNYRIRSGDHHVFTNPEFLEAVRQEDVRLITWKQLHKESHP